MIDAVRLVATYPIPAVAVSLLVALVIWRVWHRFGAEVLFLPVLAVALALTIDGMRHLAVGPMRLSGMEAWIPAIFYESVGMYLAYRAERRLKEQSDMGTYGPMVIVLGVIAGLLAASAGENIWASAARLAAPIVAVALWWARARDGGKPRGTITWLWSPRRLAIWLRIIAPGEQDEVSIDETRRVRALTRVGHRAATWPGPFGWWYRSRVAAIGRASTDEIVDGAVAQVALGWQAVMRMTSLNTAGHGHQDGQTSGHDDGQNPATLTATIPAMIWPPQRPDSGQPTGHDPATLAAMWAASNLASERPDSGHTAGHTAGQEPATDVDPDAAKKEIARRLRRGQRVTRTTVMDLYGVSDGTAGRWLAAAKTMATPTNGKAVRLATKTTDGEERSA